MGMLFVWLGIVFFGEDMSLPMGKFHLWTPMEPQEVNSEHQEKNNQSTNS